MSEPAATATPAETPVVEATPIATQVLDADDQLGENDSAIGDDDMSSSASLASSIYKFREENGLTYNAYGDRTYFMPNDEKEKDRLDLQHHLFGLTLGGGNLYTAPLDTSKVHRVLDVGTGTGIWAMDFADAHPEAEVYGVDVSPIQPQFVPPNVKFEIDDLEKPWTFSTGFDFIFSRLMTGSFSDWKVYLEKCFENTRPGGYMEIEDIYPLLRADDDTLKGTALEKYGILCVDGGKKMGINIDTAVITKDLMEEVGFVDVKQVIYKWPTNRWPADKQMKEIGLWSHENATSNLYGLSAALFTRGLGWSVEEMQVFLADVRKDMQSHKVHAYWPIYVIYGRKPE